MRSRRGLSKGRSPFPTLARHTPFQLFQPIPSEQRNKWTQGVIVRVFHRRAGVPAGGTHTTAAKRGGQFAFPMQEKRMHGTTNCSMHGSTNF